MPEQRCVIIFRNMPVRVHDPEHPEHDHDAIDKYPIAVYGPLSRREAAARVEQINKCCADPEEDLGYRPVRNAPACLGQEKWDEHWAMLCPMNDVPW